MKPEGVNTDILVTTAKSNPDHNAVGERKRKPEPETQKITVILEISVKKTSSWELQPVSAAYICVIHQVAK